MARLRQETLALTLRGDLTFTPHLALQAYLQPFSSTGRYDAVQRLAAPRDPNPARRFEPTTPVRPPPDAQSRTLNGDLVLRWEYFPGSFLTVVWNHQRNVIALDPDLSAASGFGRLLGDPPTNVLLVKVSRRFGS